MTEFTAISWFCSPQRCLAAVCPQSSAKRCRSPPVSAPAPGPGPGTADLPHALQGVATLFSGAEWPCAVDQQLLGCDSAAAVEERPGREGPEGRPAPAQGPFCCE